jgi:plasmid maintenance system antidote protein VapI
MPQATLASTIGVHVADISEMERGLRTIGKKMAKRLGKALSMPYKAFLSQASNLGQFMSHASNPSWKKKTRTSRRPQCQRVRALPGSKIAIFATSHT